IPVSEEDGAITVDPILYGDVSDDGSVSAYDASLVLQHVVGLINLSPEQQEVADVTGDDTISALDAALILQYTVGLITSFPVDNPPVAPALNSKNENKLLTKAIEQLEAISLTKEQKQVLEQLKNLVFNQLIPKHTKLLPNYPNPFNPETWIPFELASDSSVVVGIYNVKGELVRTLDLGVKEAGYYMDKTSAGHWDGRSQTGEQVASGLYFYTIKAGKFIATRRMVMVK
nr:T9SS type A sorting domain-containing protein [bacterium]